MLGILDPYEAYCFDEAVAVFGNGVQEAVEEARSSGKGSDKQRQARAENVLRRMLGMKQRFRSISAPTERPPKPEHFEKE